MLLWHFDEYSDESYKKCTHGENNPLPTHAEDKPYIPVFWKEFRLKCQFQDSVAYFDDGPLIF